MTKELPELKNFILPGGSVLVAQIHISRTVARRAERNVVALNEIEAIEGIIIQYLNRLSDYLFTLGRFMAQETGVEEIKWTSRPG
jgi:cob(I)alamin adenosyltransferase